MVEPRLAFRRRRVGASVKTSLPQDNFGGLGPSVHPRLKPAEYPPSLSVLELGPRPRLLLRVCRHGWPLREGAPTDGSTRSPGHRRGKSQVAHIPLVAIGEGAEWRHWRRASVQALQGPYAAGLDATWLALLSFSPLQAALGSRLVHEKALRRCCRSSVAGSSSAAWPGNKAGSAR